MSQDFGILLLNIANVICEPNPPCSFHNVLRAQQPLVHLSPRPRLVQHPLGLPLVYPLALWLALWVFHGTVNGITVRVERRVEQLWRDGDVLA